MSFSRHSLPSGENLNSSVHNYKNIQITKATFVSAEMNPLTCSAATPRNSTNAHKMSSPDKMGNRLATITGKMWSPINADTLALPTTRGKMKHAHLETKTSVVFTHGKPGDMQGLVDVGGPEEPMRDDQKMHSGSSNMSSTEVSMAPLIEKVISLPHYRFHPYQAPLPRQRHSDVHNHTCPMGQKQQSKQAIDTCSSGTSEGFPQGKEGEQQVDILLQECQQATREGAWKDLNQVSKWQSNQQLVMSAFTSPNIPVSPDYVASNLMSPMGSPQGSFCVSDERQSPMDSLLQTGLEGMPAYPARAAFNPPLTMSEYFSGCDPNVETCRISESGALKALLQAHPLSPLANVWPLMKPKNDLGYSSIHSQGSLNSGGVNLAHAQEKRGEQLPALPFPWSNSNMPQIMHDASSTPCGIARTKVSAEDQLLLYPHSMSLPVHQHFAPIPTIPPRAYPIHYPFWTRPPIDCMGNQVPIRPKPNVSQTYPVMYQEGSRSVQQYPDASDMFKTANLLPEECLHQGSHMKVNRVTPETLPNLLETLWQFPMRNVIPVKLKVQDDTCTENTKSKRDAGHDEAAANANVDNKELANDEAANCGGKQSKAKKSYQCTTCKKFFCRLSTLKTHMRIHTGEKPFKCRFCSHTFVQASALQSHERSHTGEKPYTCYVCQNSFSHSCALRTHMRIHTGERPFHCTWDGCNKMFSDKSTLMKHQRVHTGEKPYTCNDCGTKFTQIGNMRKHQVKQHGAAKPGKMHTKNSTQDSAQGKTSDIATSEEP